MCRIGALKSTSPLAPKVALKLMLPQQEGHDNSGFALVMQDLAGAFAHYKDKPLLSMACTHKGIQLVNAYMEQHGFVQLAQWVPDVCKDQKLNIRAMPRYVFRTYDLPEIYQYRSQKARDDFLLDSRLELRELLSLEDNGYVYSFWPDVLTLKEIGDPADIATYFRLWEDDSRLLAKNIVVQCRQNTNYDIVRYAAHPFFLQGYTLCANGENTFFTKNMELQKSLHRGYIGFESDSQTFLYTLHYVLHELEWPIKYFKHVVTPLSPEEAQERPDFEVLALIRKSLANLEINGPNTIIAMLPDSTLVSLCDAKKLRPVVIGRDENLVAISSEVCGLNAILPHRDVTQDIYTEERELITINNDLEVQRWKQ
ncbi:MAG: glutamate synthase [Desulfovibrionaceae bacterium]|nr:glutamate synthase [Desulfovibrionaceae bacterium]